MLQTYTAGLRPSTANDRSAFRSTERNFGRVARALWPHKTAAELAARAGVSHRAAELWLAGGTPSARALAVIIAELLG